MWVCSQCNEVMKENFDACWNCGASRNGEPDPDFQVEDTVRDLRERRRTTLRCLRCDRELDYMGTRRFHEGARLGVFGELAELFVNRENFDVYTCGRCGHVDFFVAGAGSGPGSSASGEVP